MIILSVSYLFIYLLVCSHEILILLPSSFHYYAHNFNRVLKFVCSYLHSFIFFEIANYVCMLTISFFLSFCCQKIWLFLYFSNFDIIPWLIFYQFWSEFLSLRALKLFADFLSLNRTSFFKICYFYHILFMFSISFYKNPKQWFSLLFHLEFHHWEICLIFLFL